MQKLKSANTSTKERLEKTIRKMFVYDSKEEISKIV
jgi:hypothetical protein